MEKTTDSTLVRVICSQQIISWDLKNETYDKEKDVESNKDKITSVYKLGDSKGNFLVVVSKSKVDGKGNPQPDEYRLKMASADLKTLSEPKFL